MGSADISCPSLLKLVNSHYQVSSVVTQPDRPCGRKLKLKSCPVKTTSLSLGLSVLTPDNINAPEIIRLLKSMMPDIVVVVAYGQILKKEILDIPRYGCLNLHASLLPKYRGAAPIQRAIIDGAEITGVTTMFMNEEHDAGDIIFQQETRIGYEETAGELYNRLAEMGANLLLKTLVAIENGTAPRIKQDNSQATYAPKLTKSEGKIIWTKSAVEIYNKVRGLNPWPCCFCEAPINSKNIIRVLQCRILPEIMDEPGKIIMAKDRLIVASGKGGVELLEVQPPGRTVMDAKSYLCGHVIKEGEIMG